MALQMNNAQERADFILDQGPFRVEFLNTLPPHVAEDYILTADSHLTRVGPEKFLENKEALKEYAEEWIFQEKWEGSPVTPNLPNRQKKRMRSDDGGGEKPEPGKDASMNSSDKPEHSLKGSLALEIIQELQEKSILPMEG